MKRFSGLSAIPATPSSPPSPKQAAPLPAGPLPSANYGSVLRDAGSRINDALQALPALSSYLRGVTGFHDVARKIGNPVLAEKVEIAETLSGRVDGLCLAGAPVNQIEGAVSLWERAEVEILKGLSAAVQAPQKGLF